MKTLPSVSFPEKVNKLSIAGLNFEKFASIFQISHLFFVLVLSNLDQIFLVNTFGLLWRDSGMFVFLL